MKKKPRSLTKSVYWTVGSRIVFNSIGLISTIILARLLEPTDFGIVAMVTVIVAFIQLLSNQGFETYLITAKRATRKHYETVWTLKFSIHFVFGLILLGMNNIIADFYAEPKLIDVVIVMAIAFMLNGLVNIRIVTFQKDLNFQPFFIMQVIPKFISFILTISLALYLRNYWALVYGILASTLVSITLSYCIRPWVPRMSFSAYKEIIHYTKWLLSANILSFINNKGIDLLVGRYLGANSLGILSIAKDFVDIPNQLLIAPINRALLSGYARLKNNKEKLNELILNSLSLISLVVVPSGLGMMICSEQIVQVLLGNKWSDMVPVLQWMALSIPFTTISITVGYVYLAYEKTKYKAYMAAIYMFVILLSLLYLLPNYGLKGAGISMLIASVIMLISNQIFIRHLLNYNFFYILLNVLFTPVLSSLFMVYAILAYTSGLTNTSIFSLVMSIIIGIISYSLASFIFLKLNIINKASNDYIISLLYEKGFAVIRFFK